MPIEIMCQKSIVLCVCFVYFVHGDVSHLFKNAYNTYQSALNTINTNGYYYDPPIVPTTSRPLPPTTPFLPEIIVNKKSPDFTLIHDYPRAAYLPPPADHPIIIPPQADDFDSAYLPPPIPPTPSYLPPTPLVPQHDPPPQEYLPPAAPPFTPQSDEIPDDNGGYHYPTPQSRGLKELDLFRSVKHSPLQLELNDLRCLNSRIGYFKANVVVQSFIEHLPIIDVDVQDQRCQIHLVRTKFVINLSASDFHRCGVYACGDQELCLNLRFPQISGMKSIGDAILTLQCKIQKTTVSKTHALRFGVTNFNQGRSAGTFAQGGSQQPFRTQLGLFRNLDGAFTKSLESGSVVQLGEELMLRAQVKSGDGWNHSRVSDVSLQRLSPTNELLNSITLIKSDGCVNPSMRAICPYPPVFEPPLGYRIGFRAVMFQGMKSGDEMIMSIRIVGCIDHRDCSVEHQHCSDHTAGRIHRRDVEKQQEDELVEVSRISFRVEMPKSVTEDENSTKYGELNIVGSIGAAVTVCCVCILAIIGFTISNRRHLESYFGRF